jgi:hypothetical protein
MPTMISPGPGPEQGYSALALGARQAMITVSGKINSPRLVKEATDKFIFELLNDSCI